MKLSVDCLAPLFDVTIHLRYTLMHTALPISDGFRSATPVMSSSCIGFFPADFAVQLMRRHLTFSLTTIYQLYALV